MEATTIDKVTVEDSETGEKTDISPLKDQLSLMPGGHKPISGEVKLKATKKDIENEYKMGDTVKLEIEAVVTEVAFVDVFDKDGY